MTIRIWKDNRSPSLTDNLTVPDTSVVPPVSPMDLTGCSVKFRMRPESSSDLTVDNDAVINDAPNGAVQYNWDAEDVATAGTYQAWWSITLSSGLIQDTDEFALVIAEHAYGIDLATIREHVETGLSDDALALMVQDFQDELTDRYGDDSNVSIRLYGNGEDSFKLVRPAASVVSIHERYYLSGDDNFVTLAADQYELTNGGRTLTRLVGQDSFYHWHWAPIVDVVYVPVSESRARQRVIINLCKLEVQYNGAMTEKIGDYQIEMNDRTGGQTIYLRERERLIASLGARRGFRFA